jgi:hypothetical protein
MQTMQGSSAVQCSAVQCSAVQWDVQCIAALQSWQALTPGGQKKIQRKLLRNRDKIKVCAVSPLLSRKCTGLSVQVAIINCDPRNHWPKLKLIL